MNHTEKHTIRGAKSILFSSSEFLKDRAPMLTVGGSLQQMDVRMEKVRVKHKRARLPRENAID